MGAKSRRGDSIHPSDSVSMSGPQGAPEVVVILGFSLDLAKNDMTQVVTDILIPILPSTITMPELSVEAYGHGNSCRIRCPSASVAKLLVDHARTKEIKWQVPDDGISDVLRMKFEEPYSIRKCGGFCFHVFRRLADACRSHNIAMQPAPFVTAKMAGKVSLRIGKGYSVACKFSYKEHEGIQVKYEDSAKFPTWISKVDFRNLVDAVVEESCL